MRVLVLGAGGIGGYFGGRLAQSGVPVTFLVRQARAKKIKEHGLVIVSPLGDARIAADVATTETLAGAYNLVILSCKAYDLETAIAAVRPAVGEQTTILPLLNGLAHLDALDAAFGADKVIGGLAHISVTLGDDGSIRHLNKLQSLTYGPREPAQTARCDALAPLFEQASFDVRRTDKVMQDMWEKFAFITAAASITCLMRASVVAIMATRDGERLTHEMLDECNGVAAAAGFTIRDKAQSWATPFLTDRKSDFTASMLRDLENGGQIEADQLPGDMIARGDALGTKVTLLRVAYAHLQAYQNMRARKG